MKSQNSKGTLLDVLPNQLAAFISKAGKESDLEISDIEEIRLRAEQPLVVRGKGKNYTVPGNISEAYIRDLLNHLTGYSFYAYEEQLSEGYLTLQGGHRVGVCGKCILENGKVKLIKSPSSINIRQAMEIKGCADKVIPYMVKREKENKISIANTLIISPPKCGKTTMLRDIARQISRAGFTVCICDERGEIAGMHGNVPSFDLGPNTDVLMGCQKYEGIEMLQRSMSPDVIITDELGGTEDESAVRKAFWGGVAVVATMHGHNLDGIPKGIFERLIFLSADPRVGTVREIKYV